MPERCTICHRVNQQAFMCCNAHGVCIDCARAHVEPSKPRSQTCAGLRFQCPTCDEGCVLSKIDMLVLIKGAPLKAFGCFDFKVDALDWMRGESFHPRKRRRVVA